MRFLITKPSIINSLLLIIVTFNFDASAQLPRGAGNAPVPFQLTVKELEKISSLDIPSLNRYADTKGMTHFQPKDGDDGYEHYISVSSKGNFQMFKKPKDSELFGPSSVIQYVWESKSTYETFKASLYNYRYKFVSVSLASSAPIETLESTNFVLQFLTEESNGKRFYSATISKKR